MSAVVRLEYVHFFKRYITIGKPFFLITEKSAMFQKSELCNTITKSSVTAKDIVMLSHVII